MLLRHKSVRMASIIVGALAGCFPHGDLNLTEEDDVVWHAVVDAGLPLASPELES